MRSRGLVVAIAVVLAVLAAVGVIVYTNQREDGDDREHGRRRRLQPETSTRARILNPLIDQGGVFKQIRVPNDALVEGAVATSTSSGPE